MKNKKLKTFFKIFFLIPYFIYLIIFLKVKVWLATRKFKKILKKEKIPNDIIDDLTEQYRIKLRDLFKLF